MLKAWVPKLFTPLLKLVGNRHLIKPLAGNKLTKVSRVFNSGFDPLHGDPDQAKKICRLGPHWKFRGGAHQGRGLCSNQPTNLQSENESIGVRQVLKQVRIDH